MLVCRWKTRMTGGTGKRERLRTKREKEGGRDTRKRLTQMTTEEKAEARSPTWMKTAWAVQMLVGK